MQDLPHHYHVKAFGQPEGTVALDSGNLPRLVSAPPAEFGGPGDQWSPETLLVASVANCFVLTFRAIARASKLSWSDLDCAAQGMLERVEQATCFTTINLQVKLKVPTGTDLDRARRLLEKSEENCLITRSLNARTHLATEVVVEG